MKEFDARAHAAAEGIESRAHSPGPASPRSALIVAAAGGGILMYLKERAPEKFEELMDRD